MENKGRDRDGIEEDYRNIKEQFDDMEHQKHEAELAVAPLKVSTETGSPQIRLLHRAKSKAAISLPFNLHYKAIAALFFIPIVVLFEGIACH